MQNAMIELYDVRGLDPTSGIEDEPFWAFPMSSSFSVTVGQDFHFMEDHRGPYEDKTVIRCDGVVSKVKNFIFGNSGKGLPDCHQSIYIDVHEMTIWDAEKGEPKVILGPDVK